MARLSELSVFCFYQLYSQLLGSLQIMAGQQSQVSNGNVGQKDLADAQLDKFSQQFPEIVGELKKEFQLMWGFVQEQRDKVSSLIQEQQHLQQIHNITQQRAQLLKQSLKLQNEEVRSKSDNIINEFINGEDNSKNDIQGTTSDVGCGENVSIKEDARTMLQLPGDKLCVIGGRSGDYWISSINLYNIEENEWCNLSVLPENCAQQATAVSFNQKLLVCGGSRSGDISSQAIQLDFNNASWTQVCSMTCDRVGHGMQVLDGRAYAIGGKCGELEFLQTVECWDMEKDLWMDTPSMNQKRYSFAALQHQTAIYAVGGFDGADYLKSIERYDPREGKWELCGEMLKARGSHVGGQHEGVIYSACGYDGADFHTHAEFWDIRAQKAQNLPDVPILHAYSAGGVLNGKFCLYAGKHSGNKYNKSIAILSLNDGGMKPLEWEVLGLQGEEEIGRAHV
eukprot:TRINITY_DN7222_c0_g1_i4.p1 TRINITY_DN7222_c0_g1~~TRINITY_DN7222_c0_g1_i4.p1  ORF type:complete len:472 (-),score=72.16 TRINITY_DN7222_c0_g1_i4:72-1427(-)